jgi:hypothetical protein
MRNNRPRSRRSRLTPTAWWSTPGTLYVADAVGAIFMFTTETKDVQLIKNGFNAFGDVQGLAIDDSDCLFASDTKMHRIPVFDRNQQGGGARSPTCR